jgi:hypothetical protein
MSQLPHLPVNRVPLRRERNTLRAGTLGLIRQSRLVDMRSLRAVLGLVVLLVMSCQQGASHPPSGQIPIRPSHRVQPDGVPRTVRLGVGRVTVMYPVEALDPPTHTYSVRVVLPLEADIAAWFTTDYGQKLHILDSSFRADVCIVHHRLRVCQPQYPALEAQHGGVWTLHILKRTMPPATVTVTVRFEEVRSVVAGLSLDGCTGRPPALVLPKGEEMGSLRGDWTRDGPPLMSNPVGTTSRNPGSEEASPPLTRCRHGSGPRA